MGERSGGAILLAGMGVLILCGCVLASSDAFANGWLESRPWQFETSADKANKAAVVDLIERKKGGYYDSFKTNITNNNVNNTYIDRQVNCSVGASATGNSGSNGMSGSASSPTVTNTSSNNANTTGNSNSSGVNNTDPAGVVIDNNGTNPSTVVDTNQSNNGSNLGSGVTNSASNSASGPIAANGGTVNQALNSNQSNTGAQTATVANRPAC